VEEARRRVLDAIHPLPAEARPLADALGCVLASAVYAPLDLPPWDNSAMDGFAVRRADVLGASQASPVELRVVGEVAAGYFPERALGEGEAIRIMTGAPVPEGADTVIRVEHTGSGGEGRVRILSDADAGRNVRARGEDVRRGAEVLAAGTVLGAAAIGVAASLGQVTLPVVRRPVVAVLTSGDELVEVERFDEVLAGRRIVSSNSYALAAQLAEAGCAVRPLGIAADTRESLLAHLEGARGCDALITSAGISMGEHDLMRDVLLELGAEVAFWRVKMRPGSPFAFGRVAALGGIPWFGLPGNPVSSMVTFEVFARPALLRMAGHRAVFAPTARVTMQDRYATAPGLTHFARVRLEHDAEGEIRARLTGAQGSGLLTSMAAADALLVIPPERPGTTPGERLRVILLGGAPLQPSPGY
jgi:molybdopterin molybdotransferase